MIIMIILMGLFWIIVGVMMIVGFSQSIRKQASKRQISANERLETIRNRLLQENANRKRNLQVKQQRAKKPLPVAPVQQRHAVDSEPPEDYSDIVSHEPVDYSDIVSHEPVDYSDIETTNLYEDWEVTLEHLSSQDGGASRQLHPKRHTALQKMVIYAEILGPPKGLDVTKYEEL